MNISRTSDLWWKNATIYCLDVETFMDANGDGCGDFLGMTQRIDHLARLGVSCIWLMPFYPSPNRDDGYDISDYYNVDPRLGTLGDFVEFMRTARDRGIRVIADLVVNHTSDQHPWFQAARSDRNSPYRDWYVWRDAIPEDGPTEEVFPGQQNGVWQYDDVAGQFYMHRFYGHQPDLNIANPAVREEIYRIVGFWLQLGIDGFRVDAVPYLLEIEGNSETMDIAPHDWLRELRSFISRRNGGSMLMGEVNLPYEDTRKFFGDHGDELHMCLNFNANQAFALSLARGDAGPLMHSLQALPSLPEGAAWANFVRNHDEWSLDKLTAAERREVFDAFGPRPDMQLFGRGLRRRLPSMLGGDQDRLRMAYALNFAMPGAAVLFYGEEIGMAENLDIPERLAVRSPMQWTDEPSAGFSTADPESLWRPLVGGRKFGPKAVNVAEQRKRSDSLLCFMESMIWARDTSPEIAFGTMSFPPVEEAAVLAIAYEWGDSTFLTVFNLAEAPLKVALPLGGKGTIESVLGTGAADFARDGTLTLELGRYGYRWLRITDMA